MPLPAILIAAAAITGTIGTGAAISGGVKMKEANDTAKSAERRHKDNVSRLKKAEDKTNITIDNLGKKELEILDSFQRFNVRIERIIDRPDYDEISNGFQLPKCDIQSLNDVSVGAGVILGCLGGAAAGTAGGIAAGGATTAAVMALGTASTGTAIASLSGAAATNATLAALGGGALAAGGGGMALGTAVLGGATLGVGLLLGGLIFSLTGSHISEKADEAWRQMKKFEDKVNKACSFMDELCDYSNRYLDTLNSVNDIYINYLTRLETIIDLNKDYKWKNFNEDEKKVIYINMSLTALLFDMCNVQLTLKNEDNTDTDTINKIELDTKIAESSNKVNEITLIAERKAQEDTKKNRSIFSRLFHH